MRDKKINKALNKESTALHYADKDLLVFSVAYSGVSFT